MSVLPVDLTVVAPWVVADDRHPVVTYLGRLSAGRRRSAAGAQKLEGSQRTMEQALNAMAALMTAERLDAYEFPWHRLRYEHTAALASRLKELHAPATVNKYLSALRGVLKEAWRLGLMTAEDYQRAADVGSAKGSRLPPGRHVDQGELAALAEACRLDTSPSGARDAAMLAMTFMAGLRLDEMVTLDLGHVDLETGAVRVLGKGNKERTTYLASGGLAALTEWLAIRESAPGALFCPVNQKGKVTLRPLTGQAVYARFRKRGLEAGLAKAFSPHDGRRTFIGQLLESGADISIVQHLVGHASPTTTAGYDRRPEHVKRQAVAKLYFPWKAQRAL